MKKVFVITLLLTNYYAFSQFSTTTVTKSEFWQKVQFGGGLGLTFGDFTNVTIAPQAIYNINKFVSVGVGIQYNYLKNRDISKATMVGGSFLGLFNPVKSVQLSLELEQLHVNQTVLLTTPNVRNQFWNTAAFVGGGYQVGGLVIGGRYNLLFDKDKNI